MSGFSSEQPRPCHVRLAWAQACASRVWWGHGPGQLPLGTGEHTRDARRFGFWARLSHLLGDYRNVSVPLGALVSLARKWESRWSSADRGHLAVK